MKKIYLLISIFALMLGSSCTDLTEKEYDIIGSGMFPKTAEDADGLVTAAAYGPFVSNWYSGVFTVAQSGVQTYTEMTTDIGYCQWNDAVWPDLLNVHFTPNSSGPTRTYATYINSLSKMTQALERLKAMDIDDAMKNQYMAEVHCGRGWLAYILYDLYGPLQIASPELLSSGKDEVLPRSTAEETVKFIEDDLQEAIKYLPARYHKSDANYGRFTKAVAYTVLMKLYMHEKEWKKAVECGKELMKPEYGFQLVPHYKDIFTLENEGNDETIWAAVCSTSGNQQLWLAHVLSSQYPTKNASIQKWGGYRVLWDFYHTFDPKDERLQVLVGDFVGTDGVEYNEKNPGTVLFGGALPIKYGEDPNATGEESQIDWIVFRYADVLTLLAEAECRADNRVSEEAVSLLNRVHERAGLAPYKLNDFASPEAFLDAVLLERGHELWFEDCRRTDLIRYGKYIEYAKKYRHSTTAADYMTLMPLPQSIIDEGKGQVVQNPGY
ncbi:MAG: RagB/SusD family nutrient uptake outer membrane protein [Prevotella sp.]|jgi:hypothetical protein|nr:RagB/SusD family nutrient uptake outer membrane protein [Prevotella sp.]HCN54429.1 RagB/SusD family nutrient uptake outer membrane protein [Prevotella sp.]